MTPVSTENPQKARSRAEMAAALVELLGEVPYRQVTVTMLAARSGYSRRTFYRHFDSVDAVMEGLMRGLGAEFSARAMDALDEGRSFSDLAQAFFSFWCERAGLLALLERNDLMHLVSRCFWPGFRADMLGDAGKGTGLEYGYRFMAGGMSSMLEQWVEEGCARSPEDLALIAGRMADHLAAGVRLPPVVGAGSAGDLPSRCQVGTSAAAVRHPAADG